MIVWTVRYRGTLLAVADTYEAADDRAEALRMEKHLAREHITIKGQGRHPRWTDPAWWAEFHGKYGQEIPT